MERRTRHQPACCPVKGEGMPPLRALKDRRAFLKFLAASPIMASAGFTSGWADDLMAAPFVPQDTAALGAQNEAVIQSVKEELRVFDFDAVTRTKLSTAPYQF